LLFYKKGIIMKTKNTLFSQTKLYLSLFIIVIISFNESSYAQKVEITPFYGYMFAGKVQGYYGDLNIRDAGMYGLMLDINVQKGMQVELYYSRTDTRADFVEYRGPTYKLTDMSVNYFQLGFLRTVKKMDNIEMFGVGSLGATLFSPNGQPYEEYEGTDEQIYFEDWWLFSLTLGGGAKIWMSDRVGLRLEGRLMMPITWAGGGFMVGSGGGGFYLGGGSAILEASLTAGLIIALGD
jgi:opacity protein-like surface antigen